jgi:hypothetical protein
MYFLIEGRERNFRYFSHRKGQIYKCTSPTTPGQERKTGNDKENEYKTETETPTQHGNEFLGLS